MLNKLEVLLVSNSINVRYLTGFDGSFGWCLLWEEDGELRKFLITDSRYRGYVENQVFDGIEICDLSKRPFENLNDFVNKKRLKSLGFEAGNVTVLKLKEWQEKVSGVEWFAVEDRIERMRAVKSDLEINLIVASQSLNMEIFEMIKNELSSGMTEKDIAWRIECLARERGCDGLSFPPIIAINEHSACPHHKNTDRRFEDGDFLLVDMGVVWQGYCSDMTRIIFTGEKTNEQKLVYDLVEKAQKYALENISSGMDAVEADSLARNIIEEAGYGKEFCHSLGHGVGLEVHEKPLLSSKSNDVLEKGMVVTVEPGIYLEGKFGVRLEDILVIN